jgi:hypothetical protein
MLRKKCIAISESCWSTGGSNMAASFLFVLPTEIFCDVRFVLEALVFDVADISVDTFAFESALDRCSTFALTISDSSLNLTIKGFSTMQHSKPFAGLERVTVDVADVAGIIGVADVADVAEVSGADAVNNVSSVSRADAVAETCAIESACDWRSDFALTNSDSSLNPTSRRL